MANYRLSAELNARDGGLVAALRAVQQEASKLKDLDLLWKVGVDGIEKLKRLQSMAKGMKFSPIRITANDQASSKVSRLKSQLTSIAGKVHNVVVNVQTRGAERLAGLKTNLSELGSGMMMAGGLGVMGVAGIGYGIADTINTYKDFEMQMRRNKALFTTGMAPEDAQPIYEQLINIARQYGSTMIFTNAQVGKALEYMALAGWDAQTSMKALPAILNASVASGEDLAMVSDIITDDMTAMGYKAGTYVQNGMGDMVEATQHFSDVLLRTTLRSNTNFQQLGYAMKYAAPLAHALGYNIEDVAIAMGLMANNGIKADQAGTALRGMLVRMAKAPKQAAEAMEALGVSAFDAAGKSKGLMANLMDIRAALMGKDAEKILDFVEQMTGEEIGQRGEVADYIKQEMAQNGGKLTDKSLAKLASQFSGTYALAGFLALMNSTDEDIQKLMTEIYQKSDGTGAEINKDMMDTLTGDLKTLQSAWEDFQYELMNGKGASGLRDFLQAAIKDINAFKNALKDGFDIGDIFELLGNIITQIKNKFLALDGIGSLLAGGVLMVGLRKLLNMGLRVRNMLGEITKLGASAALTGAKASTIPPTAAGSSVGTMNVKAGVVNLSGAIKGAPVGGVVGGGAGGKAVTTLAAAQANAQAATNKYQTAQAAALAAQARAAQTKSIPDMAAARAAQAEALAAQAEATAANRRVTAIQNSQRTAQNYYAQRETFNAQNQAIAATNENRALRIANARSAAGGAAAFAALFGVMDVMSTRSMGKAQVADITAEIDEQKRILKELSSNSETSQDQLARQVETIRGLESQRNDILQQNREAEFRAGAGAAGSIAGSALGAALGSLVGPMGMMFGGMIGGAIGQYLGEFVGNKRVEQGLGGQDVKPEVNGAIIADAVSKIIPTQPPTYEFKNPLEREKHDITGLMHKGNYWEPAQPFEAKPSTLAPMPELQRGYGHHGWSLERSIARAQQETEEFAAAARQRRFSYEQFRMRSDQNVPQQPFPTQPPVKLPEFKWPELKLPTSPLRSDQSIQQQPFATQPPVKLPDFTFAEMMDDLLGFKHAAAAELTPEQLAQQAAMERGEPIQPAPIQPPETPDLGLAGLTEGFYSQLEGLGEGVGEIFSGLGETIQTGLTSALEGAGETLSTFGETIQTGLTSALEGAGETFMTFGTTLQEGFMTALESVGTTFSGLGEVIGLGLTTAQATADASIASIKATFDSGLQAIQSAWGALPGFFSGVFSSLGGVASAAGAAIAAGLTSVIGGIIGAWQSAAATISGIISSIASMAASVGSMIPSIGGHYKGTASFAGGFTEINEHGGELMILPSGTKIYPHATTVELLRREIQQRMREQDGLRDLGMGELTVPFPEPFAPPTAEQESLPVPRFNFPTPNGESDNRTSNVDNSSQNVSINMGGVNINSGMDFDDFMHQMRSLITGAAENSIQF